MIWLETQDTSLENYIVQDYPRTRESSEFWFNTVDQRNNISLLTDTTIDTNNGIFEWENKGKEDTSLHFVFGYPVGKYTTLSLQSDTELGFRLHHYLYKRNLDCNPISYPRRWEADPHDKLWIDSLRNKRSNKTSQSILVNNEGFGGNCFLQGELIPLGQNEYAGNYNYQLTLPKLNGLDNTYKIYTFYSIHHGLEKNRYQVHRKLDNTILPIPTLEQ